MPEVNKKMQFQKNYFTPENMNKAGEGAYSSNFKAYITDGNSALKDKIHQTDTQKNRQQVMRDIRKGLRDRMNENNENSRKAAEDMMKEHKSLREQMQVALMKAKEATRQKKLLNAKLLAERSRQSNALAETSETELNGIVSEETEALREDNVLLNRKKRRAMGNKVMPRGNVNAEKTEDDVSARDVEQRTADLTYLNSLKDVATQNKSAVHKKNLFSVFRAIGKKMDRDSTEGDLAKQEAVIREQQRVLRDKTKAWNEKRKKDYDSGSFRKYYNDYDSAIQSYRALNRNNVDTSLLPKKDIREYVGEFDLDTLDETLGKLENNPYLNAEIKIKNKKAGRGIEDADLIKSHSKITLLSEENEDGIQVRYKLSEDFKGYMAARQFKPDDPSALTDRPKKFRKGKKLTADEMRLQIDEKDAANKFINTQDNLEIIQAKTKVILTGKKVNGVFLNGEFLSADRKVIKGMKDGHTVGMLNRWKYTKQKEEVRKAVLKADIFQLINAKSIQAAAGYEANQVSGASRIQAKMKKEIMAKCKMTEAEVNKLFSEKFEAKIFDKKSTRLQGKEDEWEKILFGKDEKKKKELPDAVKVKVAYDVIRKEINADKSKIKSISDKKSRIGKAFDIISKDQKAVIDLSLLLLSDDSHPEFWDMAKDICVNHMPYEGGFGRVEIKDRATMERAVKYARTEKGLMMRMALIDELNTQRKNFDLTNFFGALMPTKYKQYIEDLETKRGACNIIKLKAVDGTFLKFIGDVFDAVFTVGKDMELFEDATKRNMFVANIYMGAVTSCMNIGAITQAGAYAFTDYVEGDVEYKDENNKTQHTADNRKFDIGLVFTMVKNIASLVKAVNKWKEKKEKEIKLRASKEPDYDPKTDFASIQGKWHEVAFNLVTVAATMGADIAKYANDPVSKNICNMIKNSLNAVQSQMEATAAANQSLKIDNAEKDFETLATKENKTAEDEAMLTVLKKNSQLQYGMSLAKKKSNDDVATNGLKHIKSSGKAFISVLKVLQIDKIFPPLALVDGIWTVVTSIGEVGLEIHQHNTSVSQNVEKMLGPKVKDANRRVISSVLKREAGIASVNYLPDLAKIFMGINTHAFMQQAETDAEKKVGSKIATTLMNNKNYTPDKLKKVKSKDLMKAMGVKGNYRKILTHALA